MSTLVPKSKGCRVCGKQTYSRGLCQKHYRRWLAKYEAIKAADEAAADKFESDCMRDGWIIAKSRGGRPKEDPDPFDEYAFRAISEEVAEVIQEGQADIDEAIRAYTAKKVAENQAKFDNNKRRKQG